MLQLRKVWRSKQRLAQHQILSLLGEVDITGVARSAHRPVVAIKSGSAG